MVWPFSSSKRTPEETEKREKLALEKEDEAVSAASKDFRNRKLMEAINENCALESLALIECQDSWSLWNRMTLCQGSQKNYMDCLNMQRVFTPVVLCGVCCSCVIGLPCCCDCSFWVSGFMGRRCCYRWDMGGREIRREMMS